MRLVMLSWVGCKEVWGKVQRAPAVCSCLASPRCVRTVHGSVAQVALLLLAPVRGL